MSGIDNYVFYKPICKTLYIMSVGRGGTHTLNQALIEVDVMPTEPTSMWCVTYSDATTILESHNKNLVIQVVY